MKTKYLKMALAALMLSVSGLPAAAQVNEPMVHQNGETEEVDSLRQTIAEMQRVQDEQKIQLAEQEKELRWQKVWKRKKHFGLSWITSQKLTNKDYSAEQWKQQMGIALSYGKTYYLHKKPIAGMIKFGIDLDWMDITYAKYKEPGWSVDDPGEGEDSDAGNTDTPDEDEGFIPDMDFGLDEVNLGLQQIDYGLAVGPSVTVNPVQDLMVSAYFHYHPTFSVTLLDSDIYGGYVGNMSFGMTAAWRMIYLGFETRWGSGKYFGFNVEEAGEDFEDDMNGAIEDGEDDMFDFQMNEKKFKTNSFRLTIGLRF